MNILIIAGLLIFLAITLWRREWGVYLIILLLPSYQIRFSLGVPFTFLEGMILTLALRELIYLVRGKKMRSAVQTLFHSPVLTMAVAAFLFAALVSIFTGPSMIKGAGIFKAYFFEAFLFYAIVILTIDTREKLSRLIQCLALLVAYLSTFGVFQFLTLTNLPPSWWAVNVASRRITSLLNHPNALALLLGPVLSFLAFVPKNKWMWVALPLGATAMYLSFSRAAWLAIFVSILIIGLFTEHRKKILLGSLAVTVLIVVIPYSRQKLLELSLGEDPSRENRLVLWSAAGDILKESPIFGAGLTGFREEYKNYPLGPDRVVQNYPHNFFLNFWLETGLLGFISVTALLILYYKKLRIIIRQAEFKNLALGLGAAMAVVVLHGLVDVPYFKNDLAVLFWLLLALPQLKFLPS